jgi:hypothetical protein
MKKILIISALILTAASTALSQTSTDALRYSRIDIGGTARYMGLSGAFGALGADFTTASTNPAGIAFYKSSEFITTPAVHIGNVQSNYNGTLGSDTRSNFYMGNVGFVTTAKTKSDPAKHGWRSVTFATGLNRLQDFNHRYEMTGTNTSNSLLDTYVDAANGTAFKDIEDDTYGNYAFDLNLAWWAYLLDLADPNVDKQYVSPIKDGVSKQQTKSIDSWGSMNEYVFSLGANYSDRLYLGSTIGIPFIRYYESSVYTENNIQNTDLKYFKRLESLETHGSGINFKFGFIYRATDWFRFGAAFHTPSWFGNMRDYWTATMISEFYTPDNNGNTKYVENSPSGSYDYSLKTPYRIQGNLAFIIGNIGLVSADYEFANYATSRFDASSQVDGSNSFITDANSAIQKSYTGSHTIRVGTEWRYKIFSFRAGGKYFTSPYQNNINDGSRFGFSGGVGLKEGWFFMDLAYAYTQMQDDYYFYNTPAFSSNPIANSTSDHYIVMTLGVKL